MVCCRPKRNGWSSLRKICVCACRGVVGERHLLAVGTNDAGEHAVALLVVTPARAEGAETDAQFGFEPLLINGGDDAAAQRHFLELLEHEVALAVIVIEVVTVFRQPAARAILTVILPLSS